MADRGDLVWWQPLQSAAGSRPWLPAALRVQVDTEASSCSVEEGASAAELRGGSAAQHSAGVGGTGGCECGPAPLDPDTLSL